MPPRINLQEHFHDGTLDLSLADLQEVPVRDIAAIPKATTLDLSSNRIVSLPKSFPSSLTYLVKLDLCQNQLTELPDNFGLLVHLRHLDLYSNKLTSLPLSFGSLKALKWLDLKQNPLVLKLAEIAGPCLDASQCQACAKNVVSQYSIMQNQVEAERMRRQKQRLKQLEENELKAQQQKLEQQQKQKKKKKNPVKEEVNKVELKENGSTKENNENKAVESNVLPQETKPAGNKSKSIFGRIISILSSVFKFIMITSLLIMFVMFLLSLLDDNVYKLAQSKLNFATQLVRKRLPVPVVKQLDVYLTFIKNVHLVLLKHLKSFSVLAFERVQEFYVKMGHDENFVHYMQSIHSGWHFIWIKVSELYRTAMALVS